MAMKIESTEVGAETRDRGTRREKQSIEDPVRGIILKRRGTGIERMATLWFVWIRNS